MAQATQLPSPRHEQERFWSVRNWLTRRRTNIPLALFEVAVQHGNASADQDKSRHRVYITNDIGKDPYKCDEMTVGSIHHMLLLRRYMEEEDLRVCKSAIVPRFGISRATSMFLAL